MRSVSFLVLLLFLIPYSSSPKELDLQLLTAEIQKTQIHDNLFTVAVWYPVEYWKAINLTAPEEVVASMNGLLDEFDDYVVFAVSKQQISDLGEYSPVDLNIPNCTITLSINGRDGIPPLSECLVSPGVRTFFNQMKPNIRANLGQFGSGVEFYYFLNTENNISKLVNPYMDGSISLQHVESNFVWRLPLGGVLPPIFDTSTGEKFPGNYSFNPFTGRELVRIASPTQIHSDFGKIESESMETVNDTEHASPPGASSTFSENRTRPQDARLPIIPGMTPQDIYLNLENRGFSKHQQSSGVGNRSDRPRVVIFKGEDNSLQTMGVWMSYLVKTGGATEVNTVSEAAFSCSAPSRDIAASFLGYCASIPYINAQPEVTKAWVERMVRKGIQSETKIFGPARFTVSCDTPTDGAYFLDITPVLP